MCIVILAETCCVLLNSFWRGSSNYHCPKLTALHRRLDCRGSFEFQPRHKQSHQAQGGAALKARAQWLRVNITFALIFRVRSRIDAEDGFLEEYSQIVNKNTLRATYDQSVRNPFGFMYLNLLEQDRNRIFHNGFKSRFIIDQNSEETNGA